MDAINKKLTKNVCEFEGNSNSVKSYVNKVGDITFIVSNSFIDSKTLADAFEDIIISTYRQINSDPR